MGKDLETLDLKGLKWGTDEEQRQSVEDLYQRVRTKGLNTIQWYRDSRLAQKKKALRSRRWALCFFVLGLMVLPIVSLLIRFGYHFPSELGYLFFILAGACTLANQVMGFSSAWIRYATTAARLEALFDQFQLEWAELQNGDQKGLAVFLNKLQHFVVSQNQIVVQETETWAVAFQKDLSQLEQLIQEKIPHKSAGSDK